MNTELSLMGQIDDCDVTLSEMIDGLQLAVSETASQEEGFKVAIQLCREIIEQAQQGLELTTGRRM